MKQITNYILIFIFLIFPIFISAKMEVTFPNSNLQPLPDNVIPNISQNINSINTNLKIEEEQINQDQVLEIIKENPETESSDFIKYNKNSILYNYFWILISLFSIIIIFVLMIIL